MNSPGGSSSGGSREDIIDQIATEILDKLPVEFDLIKIRRTLGLDISPTTVVLLQVSKAMENMQECDHSWEIFI